MCTATQSSKHEGATLAVLTGGNGGRTNGDGAGAAVGAGPGAAEAADAEIDFTSDRKLLRDIEGEIGGAGAARGGAFGTSSLAPPPRTGAG
jgi:hypothetical protein